MSLVHSKNAKSLISSPYLKGRKQSGIDGFLTLNQMVESMPSSSQGLLTDRRHRLRRTIFPGSSLWVCENHICSHCPWTLAVRGCRCQNSFSIRKTGWGDLHATARGLCAKGSQKTSLTTKPCNLWIEASCSCLVERAWSFDETIRFYPTS